MRAYNINLPEGETIFVGIDMHNRQWRVTLRTTDVELSSASIPGDWESLRRLLERYRGTPHRGRLRGRVLRLLVA